MQFVVSDISLMEGGNLGEWESKQGRCWCMVVAFIMSEHTQLYLPSHLSERKGGERRGEERGLSLLFSLS